MVLGKKKTGSNNHVENERKPGVQLLRVYAGLRAASNIACDRCRQTVALSRGPLVVLPCPQRPRLAPARLAGGRCCGKFAVAGKQGRDWKDEQGKQGKGIVNDGWTRDCWVSFINTGRYGDQVSSRWVVQAQRSSSWFLSTPLRQWPCTCTMTSVLRAETFWSRWRPISRCFTVGGNRGWVIVASRYQYQACKPFVLMKACSPLRRAMLHYPDVTSWTPRKHSEVETVQ